MRGPHSKHYYQRLRRPGFTIVELLITVAVIAALASIGTVTYNGVQRRAATAAVLDDLIKATDEILLQEVRTRSVPHEIQGVYTPTSEVALQYLNTTLPGGLPYYASLDPPQNGKLFYDICRELVAAGLGRGPNDFKDNTIDYISGCYVYDVNYMQMNGWNGGFNISEPSVTEELLQAYVDKTKTTHPDHPSYTKTVQNFMSTLSYRYKTQGGSFPITNFWQPWKGEPVLPPYSWLTKPVTNFCLVAASKKYNDVSYVTSMTDPEPRVGTSCESE